MKQLSPEAVEVFRQECIAILSDLPDREVPIVRFPEAYYKHFGQQLLLARFGAKKLTQLFQAIPEVVQVVYVLVCVGRLQSIAVALEKSPCL